MHMVWGHVCTLVGAVGHWQGVQGGLYVLHRQVCVETECNCNYVKVIMYVCVCMHVAVRGACWPRGHMLVQLHVRL